VEEAERGGGRASDRRAAALAIQQKGKEGGREGGMASKVLVLVVQADDGSL